MPDEPRRESKRQVKAKQEGAADPAVAAAEFLPRIPLPSGPFDPTGAWVHLYRLPWPVTRRTPFGSSWLRLARTPTPDGARLEVRQRIAETGGSTYELLAEVECAADALATPRHWSVTTRLLDAQGRPVEFGTQELHGELADGRLRMPIGSSREVALAGPVAASFGLFEAVQRLPYHEGATLNFALLEELELVKPGHRLVYRGLVALHRGKDRLTLHRFDQLGPGVLPFTWWLDDQHRVVMALTSSRAWLWDPSADVDLGETR